GERRISPIGGAIVVIIFVTEPDLRGWIDKERHGRIDAPALERSEIAESVASLVHHVQAGSEILVHGLTRIEREAPVPVGTGRCCRLINTLSVGFLESSIEKTTARAATERQCAWTL